MLTGLYGFTHRLVQEPGQDFSPAQLVRVVPSPGFGHTFVLSHSRCCSVGTSRSASTSSSTVGTSRSASASSATVGTSRLVGTSSSTVSISRSVARHHAAAACGEAIGAWPAAWHLAGTAGVTSDASGGASYACSRATRREGCSPCGDASGPGKGSESRRLPHGCCKTPCGPSPSSRPRCCGAPRGRWGWRAPWARVVALWVGERPLSGQWIVRCHLCRRSERGSDGVRAPRRRFTMTMALPGRGCRTRGRQWSRPLCAVHHVAGLREAEPAFMCCFGPRCPRQRAAGNDTSQCPGAGRRRELRAGDRGVGAAWLPAAGRLLVPELWRRARADAGSTAAHGGSCAWRWTRA